MNSKSLNASSSVANSASGDSVKKIGLGSDISVTVVQKKKSIDGDSPSTSIAASKPSMGGFLSVKKESELLETPKVAKDLVQVHNIAAQNNSKATAISNANHAAATAAAKAALDLARKSLQLGAKRKSIEAIADGVDATNGNPDKNPPDPIVTISKVSGISGFPGANINKESLQQQRHDIPATVEKQTRPPTGSSHNSTPPVSSPGINQVTASSNGGNASAARPPSVPTHHSTSTSSNS